ncbi:hypothetical protein BX616_000142 [Lobosporangium transversale]|uniref:Uncharacterized protein n=1 Tax=Lobosporangium transversale TaxID=64571 RepID=A0A1Y2H117_9FUNG|nr:hypothetical protein BCR41DRAFT_391684 [Lobosporangium transversale]KAF9908475.1 hypothetical protein BX616_000142 [Lobosporangium transversale]ORZ28216.1 hypothetical protein BCR41DRAFT_391684 [Lobosporangium transversale]|eukprot:XP_021885901.1 hypothetical protein BCR41DRAFT_391684 [Lobosporangium transversale]
MSRGSQFFLDCSVEHWSDLAMFISYLSKNNPSEAPEKHLKLYQSSLRATLEDPASSDEQKKVAGNLVAQVELEHMRNAWETTGEESSPVASKRKGDRTEGRVSRFAEPWLSLMYHLRAKVKGEPQTTITRSTVHLSNLHIDIYDFVCARLSQKEQLSKVMELDVCKIDGLGEVMEELKEASAEVTEEDRVIDLNRLSDKMIQLMAVKTKAHNGIHKAVFSAVHFMALEKPNTLMSESKVVSIWEKLLGTLYRGLGVLPILISLTPAYVENISEIEVSYIEYTFISGELDSKASKYQNEIFGEELNTDTSISVYGKKEKIEWWSWEDFHLLAMDVHVTDHGPMLPHCNTSWNEFLSGTDETIATLWDYSKYLEGYAKGARRRKLKHQGTKATTYRRSVTRHPWTLGQFTVFPPTVSRFKKDANSQPSTSSTKELVEAFLYIVRHPVPTKHRKDFACAWPILYSVQSKPSGKVIIVVKRLVVQCGSSLATTTASDSLSTIGPSTAITRQYSMHVEDKAEVSIDEMSAVNSSLVARFSDLGSSPDDTQETTPLSVDLPS